MPAEQMELTIADETVADARIVLVARMLDTLNPSHCDGESRMAVDLLGDAVRCANLMEGLGFVGPIPLGTYPLSERENAVLRGACTALIEESPVPPLPLPGDEEWHEARCVAPVHAARRLLAALDCAVAP